MPQKPLFLWHFFVVLQCETERRGRRSLQNIIGALLFSVGQGLAPAVKLNSRHYKKIQEQSIVRGFLLVHFYFLSSLSSQTAPKSRALNKPFFSELLTTLSLGFFSWSVLMI